MKNNRTMRLAQSHADFEDGVTDTPQKPLETWKQDQDNSDLWHGNHGVMINTAALIERGIYFDLLLHCVVLDDVDVHAEPRLEAVKAQEHYFA